MVILCWLLGHKWRSVWGSEWPSGKPKAYEFVECVRCDRPGWRT